MNEQHTSHREPGSWRDCLPALLLLAGFTVLYMVSLAGHDPLFKVRDTVFHADANDYVVLTRQPMRPFTNGDFMLEDGYAAPEEMKQTVRLVRRRALLRKARKHPLWLPLNHGCYAAWKNMVRPFHSQWTVADERRALLFPSALFGGLAVALIFVLFRRWSHDWPAALLFALLFGVSFGKWVYASLPETYSLQTLAAVGILGMLIGFRRLGRPQALLLGLVTGLAILVSVGGVLLLLPAVLLFVLNRRTRLGLLCGASTALLVIAAYLLLAFMVSPELGLGRSVTAAAYQVADYSRADATGLPGRLLPVLANHFFHGIGAIHAQRPGFVHPLSMLHYLRSPLPAFFLLSYLLFVAMLARRLFTRGLTAPRDRVLVLVSWLGLHLVFYSLFNPAQPFLYTSIFLVPLMGLFFLLFGSTPETGSHGRRRAVRRGILALLVLATCLDNLVYFCRFFD